MDVLVFEAYDEGSAKTKSIRALLRSRGMRFVTRMGLHKVNDLWLGKDFLPPSRIP